MTSTVAAGGDVAAGGANQLLVDALQLNEVATVYGLVASTYAPAA